MFKKTLFIACLACLSFASTLNAEVWSGYCGNKLQWSLDSETGVLNITGSGNMYNHDWTSDDYRDYVQTVILPDGLTNIYSYAFESCTNLESINIPGTVTAIGNNAFNGCSSLASLTIPASVTTIGRYAISYLPCVIFEATTPPSLEYQYGLTMILVPADAIDTYRTSWSDYAELIYPNMPDNHKEITVAAMSDKSAIHMKIGDENLDKVTSLKVNGTINSYDIMIIRNKMVNLRELDIENAVIVANKYEYYTGICSQDSVLTEHAFDNTRIQVAKLPKSLKRIEASTFNPKFIRELEINSGNIAEKAFIDCSVLQKLSLTKCDSIGDFAFLGSGLKTITIPATVRYVGAFAFAGRNDNGFGGNIETTYARYHTISLVNQQDGYIIYQGKSYNLNNIVIQPDKQYVLYGSNCYLVKQENGEYYYWNGKSWKYYYRWDYPTISFFNKNGQLMVIQDNYSSYVSFSYGSGQNFYHNEYSRRSGGKLQSVIFEKGSPITKFNRNVFDGNEQLSEIIFPDNLQFIGYEALAGCAIDSLVIPESVFYIDNFAFVCSSSRYIVIPAAVDEINPYTFYNCQKLQEVKVASTIRVVGDYAFDQCPNIKKVYTYTVEPTQINQNTFSCWKNADLYVPSPSYYTYYYNTQWSQFLKLVPFDEAYNYFYVNDDYELGENGTIEGEPDVDLNPGGGLIISGDNQQELGDITQQITQELSASIIACEQNLLSSKLRIRVTMQSGVWYFLCFPFNLPLSSINWLGQYAIYEYDGAIRAANGSGGWKKFTGASLTAGKGYIFQSAISGDVEFTVPNPVFSCDLFKQALPIYAANTAYDANWTLIGNPFPAYFDMDVLFSTGFNAPVYVRSKDKDDYDAYMPHDDEYHFHPYEAFFVQNPGNVESILNWKADGRETLKQAQEGSNKAKARRAGLQKDRRFVELELRGAESQQDDHTRIVFNDNAQAAYELGRDAIKMAGNAPVRLYSLDSETQYAINERPYDNGYVQLGFSVAEDGYYTLTASRLDTAVVIYDNVENQEVDLSLGNYHFFSKAGVDNARFSIFRVKQTPTSIDELSEVIDGNVTVYTISGATLCENVALESLNLSAGTYIIQSANTVRTVILK